MGLADARETILLSATSNKYFSTISNLNCAICHSLKQLTNNQPQPQSWYHTSLNNLQLNIIKRLFDVRFTLNKYIYNRIGEQYRPIPI